MSDEKTPQTPAPAAGGSKLVPLLLVVNTGLMGATLFMAMRKPPAAAMAAPAAAGGHEEAGHEGAGKEGGGPGGVKPGVMLRLENFVIQLKSIDAERYVRVAFDLEVPTEADKDIVQTHVSRIRDSIITYFSDRTVEEMRGSDGMDRIKAALLKRFEEIVPGHRIKAVYVTEFIVQ